MTTTKDTLFLRRVLGLDAVASGAAGLLMTLGSSLLADLVALDPAVTRPAGLFLIVWAAGLAALALRPAPPRPLVLGVVAVNLLWVIESVMSLALGWLQPNAAGVAFVLAQAAAVGGFAGLQVIALGASRRTA